MCALARVQTHTVTQRRFTRFLGLGSGATTPSAFTSLCIGYRRPFARICTFWLNTPCDAASGSYRVLLQRFRLCDCCIMISRGVCPPRLGCLWCSKSVEWSFGAVVPSLPRWSGRFSLAHSRRVSCTSIHAATLVVPRPPSITYLGERDTSCRSHLARRVPGWPPPTRAHSGGQDARSGPWHTATRSSAVMKVGRQRRERESYVCVYIYIYIYMYVCVYIYIYTCTCVMLCYAMLC